MNDKNSHGQNQGWQEMVKEQEKVWMPINNNEIATKNNKGCQKGTLQTPWRVPSWIGNFDFRAKGDTMGYWEHHICVRGCQRCQEVHSWCWGTVI